MDILNKLAAELEPDPEPKADIAICSNCGWRGPVSECETDPYGDGDWETGYYPVDLCPKCKDGGCIDNYDFSPEQEKKYLEWEKRKEKGK